VTIATEQHEILVEGVVGGFGVENN